jgi:hypothetical protein
MGFGYKMVGVFCNKFMVLPSGACCLMLEFGTGEKQLIHIRKQAVKHVLEALSFDEEHIMVQKD